MSPTGGEECWHLEVEVDVELALVLVLDIWSNADRRGKDNSLGLGLDMDSHPKEDHGRNGLAVSPLKLNLLVQLKP